jgi:hypothetical protein
MQLSEAKAVHIELDDTQWPQLRNSGLSCVVRATWKRNTVKRAQTAPGNFLAEPKRIVTPPPSFYQAARFLTGCYNVETWEFRGLSNQDLAASARNNLAYQQLAHL